jgi:hypothetical protein
MAKVRRSSDLDYLPEFVHQSCLWQICECQDGERMGPRKPVVVPGGDAFWPLFTEGSHAGSFGGLGGSDDAWADLPRLRQDAGQLVPV